jgi:hypothetical protein
MSKGNAYPLWYISAQGQVMARDTAGKSHPKSDPDFAREVAVSFDGTVWVIANQPDPDGGGGKIYWSNADSVWHEIQTSAPGGHTIRGGGDSMAYYVTMSNALWVVQPDGKAQELQADHVHKISDGVGLMLWATISSAESGQALLHHCNRTKLPLQWVRFPGDATPSSLCSNTTSDCGGILNSSPWIFGSDGKSTRSAGPGADKNAQAISSRSNLYVLSKKSTPDGFEVLQFNGKTGKFESIPGLFALKIAAAG